MTAIKIEIEVDLENDYDIHFKKHNKSRYTFEDLKPEMIDYVKNHGKYYWLGDSHYQQDAHEKRLTEIFIHNTAFHKRHIVIVKTDEDRPIDKDSVINIT